MPYSVVQYEGPLVNQRRWVWESFYWANRCNVATLKDLYLAVVLRVLNVTVFQAFTMKKLQ